MPDTIRKQVIDSIIAALDASTSIQTVEDNLRSWHDYSAHQFPVVTVLDRDTDINRLSFHSTGKDKRAVMSVLTRGYVFDQNNNTATKRANLIKTIQTVLETGSTTMSALIFDIDDTVIETDDGIQDNFSVFDITYNVTYLYNHNSP